MLCIDIRNTMLWTQTVTLKRLGLLQCILFVFNKIILKILDYINVTFLSNSQPSWPCSQCSWLYICWPWSRIGWPPLRNIHFSNSNESFPFDESNIFNIILLKTNSIHCIRPNLFSVTVWVQSIVFRISMQSIYNHLTFCVCFNFCSRLCWSEILW
jgi:hypothetical protein